MSAHSHVEWHSTAAGVNLTLQRRVLEARGDVTAAEAGVRGVRNELALAIQMSYGKLARAVSAATVLGEGILPRTERLLQSAEARYASGDISLAELVPIRREWTRARLDYLEAVNEVMLAWAAICPFVR